MRTNALGTTLAALALLVGCAQTPRTEVVLSVDTDLRGVNGIDTFFVTATGPDGRVQTATASVADGVFPRTLGLVHDGGRLGPFTAVVEGQRGVTPLVARTVRFTFQEGRTLLLQIELLARCQSTVCSAGETCSTTGCRSVDIAPEELVEWTGPPPPLALDGGPLAVDAGGCAADLSSDEANCGACGHACSFANGAGECVSGECTVTSCDAGWDDCNGEGDDGCEADLETSESTCGSCTRACGGRDDTCCAGTCQRSC